jgi:hypothetical protein
MSVCLYRLGIQHAMRMRRVVICGLPGCTVFSVLSHKPRFSKKKKVIENVFFFIFSATFV